MGLTIVVGKKGSGKTAFALSQIVRELKEGRRPIVTNIQIFPLRLEAWLQENYGSSFALADRLTVLEQNDARYARWWRCRAGDWIGAWGQDPKWNDVNGTFFVLDEGQKYFPARGWSDRQKKAEGEPSLGDEAQDYLCQERKTGDDTVVTTPSSSLLDKHFRTLSTECVVLDNWYKKRIRGVRPPGRFQVRVYENCPPQVGEDAVASPHFHLDSAGLMNCYNTAAGAGFVGRQADMETPHKGGIPLWLVLSCLPLAGVAAWCSMHYGLRGGINWWGRHIAAKEVAHSVPAAPAVGVTNRPFHVPVMNAKPPEIVRRGSIWDGDGLEHQPGFDWTVVGVGSRKEYSITDSNGVIWRSWNCIDGGNEWEMRGYHWDLRKRGVQVASQTEKEHDPKRGFVDTRTNRVY